MGKLGPEVVVVQISVIVGNPKPKSRTLLIAEAVAGHVAGTTGAEVARTVDLCDYAEDLFRWPEERLDALTAAVAESDYVVFGSPTYKAAYTGLLKSFLDRYPNNGLAGVTAIPVMTGGSAHHAMSVDTALRPLLVELGASVPTRGLYFVVSQIDEMAAVVDKWAAENMPLLPSGGKE